MTCDVTFLAFLHETKTPKTVSRSLIYQQALLYNLPAAGFIDAWHVKGWVRPPPPPPPPPPPLPPPPPPPRLCLYAAVQVHSQINEEWLRRILAHQQRRPPHASFVNIIKSGDAEVDCRLEALNNNLNASDLIGASAR